MQEITVYDLYGNTLTNLVQFDTNVHICINDSRITSAYKVHFFNSTSEQALVMNSTYKNGILDVKIPNDLLEQPYAINGYVYVEENEEGKSLYGFKIPVRKKPHPYNWVHIDSHDYVTFAEIIDECKQFAQNANNSATVAKNSEIAALKSANNAKASEGNVASSASAALTSEQKAKASENASLISEVNAKASENNSKDSENKAKQSEINSKTSEQNSKLSENNALQSELNAKDSELKANKSWDNVLKLESNTRQYQLSALSSKEYTKQYMERAEKAMIDNEKYAKLSQSYATGDASDCLADSDNNTIITNNGDIICFSFYREDEEIDNAQYYYEQTKRISAGLSGALIPMGTIKYVQLSQQTKHVGYMYNISDEFTTDSTFKEGAGFIYPAGTNVYYTNDGYWDCLAGTLVTGVKGKKETSYRKGNVDITPDNIGALSIEEATLLQVDIDNAQSDIINLQNYTNNLLQTISTLQDEISFLQTMIYTGKALTCLVDDEEENITTSNGYNIYAWWNIGD